MATWVSNGFPTGSGSVQFYHDQAQTVDGDTILIPNGTFSWTTGVRITKAITIQGATTTSGDHTTQAIVPTDSTVIIDNVVPRNVSGSAPMVSITLTAGKTARVTGLTFRGNGDPLQTNQFHGFLPVSGPGQIRIDHCHFDGLNGQAHGLAFYDGVTGVVDHCLWNNFTGQQGQSSLVQGTRAAGNQVQFGIGNVEWSQPMGWGGPNFIFYEDNDLSNLQPGTHTAAVGMNAMDGGKYILRYSMLRNAEILAHGTEDGYTRGGRGYAIYRCTYYWDWPNSNLDGFRTGSVMVHDNTFIGIKPFAYGVQYYRSIWGYDGPAGGGTWFGATGDVDWDLNATRLDGTHVDGEQPFLFESGTTASGTGSNLLSDPTKNWTPNNKWRGYNVKFSNGANSAITGSTVNTLSLNEWKPQGVGPGLAYQIHKVVVALDGPGRGAGDLLTGPWPWTPRWLNQVREPFASWNNVHPASGGHVNFVITNPQPPLVEDVDYFQDKGPPVGYTEYTYPHPLVGGAVITKIISLNGNLAFGNVVIGSVSPTAALNVSNGGNTLLTVTAVSYPTGFSGATTGFTVPAGSSFGITVTFTPLLVQLYSGLITVTSDATGGTNTIACSGTGVDPTPPPPGPHGHRKQARDAFQF